MKAVIVCKSVSHGNTRRVAEVMGQALEAPVVAPDRLAPAALSPCELVGFGSGIFLGSFHSQLLEEKGFEVVDTFSCRGFDTWLPFKPFGGIRKELPNDTDLAAARTFAERLSKL